MKLPSAAISEFMQIYKKKYGVDLSPKVAEVKATSMLVFFKTIQEKKYTKNEDEYGRNLENSEGKNNS